VENIKSLNPDLDYDDVVSPRREIVVPTSPYHVSLSFDKLRTFYEKGDIVVLRGETDLSEKTLERLRILGDRSLDEFAKFVELQARTEEQHGHFRKLLEEQRANLFPKATSPENLTYTELLADLGTRGLDFLAITTHLTVRLKDAVSEGEIPLGTLEDDLAAFELRTITLDELGDHLQDLDERWEYLNSSPLRPVRGL
ncbi:MAG: hypothetical protein AAEJ65_00065, partial [Planctomycetota bacterium]